MVRRRFQGQPRPQRNPCSARDVGARLEREAVAPSTSAPPLEAQSIAIAIDGGHVIAVRGCQGRSFKVFVAQVSNDDGKYVVFSSMPAAIDQRVQQLCGVLHDLGATSHTPVTVLSDGADGPRVLGEAASKVVGVLRGLEKTDVSGQSELIIDYATARRTDEPISMAHQGRSGAVAAAPSDGRLSRDAQVTERGAPNA